jgi:hypothetical protein
MQTISFALAGMLLITGNNKAIRIPTIPITTINSMKVKPAMKEVPP